MQGATLDEDHVNGLKREPNGCGAGEPPLSGSLPALMAEEWLVKAGTLYTRAFFDLPLRT